MKKAKPTQTLAALKQDPLNARGHSPRNIEVIRESLAKFGPARPILVDGDTDTILAGNGVSLSIAVSCRNPNSMRKYDQINTALAETLRVGSSSASSRGQAAAQPSTEATYTVAEWDLARKMMRIEGIMKKGKAYVALVNGRLVKEGDVVSVYSKGDKFRFTVTVIGPKNVEFEPMTGE